MSGKWHRITREELFRQVWTQPVIKLAKEYGLSDVGLAKICKRMDIPKPPQGYWAKKDRPSPPPLPPYDGPSFHEIWHEEVDQQEPESLDPRAKALIEFERDLKNQIKVGKKLRNPHPLVTATKEALLKAEPDKYGRRFSIAPRTRDPRGVEVTLCPPSINRGMLILDALVKAMENRGYQVRSNEGEAEVTILDEKLTFTLEEAISKHEPTLSPQQAKLREERPGLFTRYTYEPTGNLSLKITQWGTIRRVKWSDGKKHRLEESLNQFIIGLVHAALGMKKGRLEDQRREEAWKREREEREERERQIKAENARREKLKTDASNWVKARQIREFIAAKREKEIIERGRVAAESELSKWIEWASGYADYLDPLSGD